MGVNMNTARLLVVLILSTSFAAFAEQSGLPTASQIDPPHQMPAQPASADGVSTGLPQPAAAGAAQPVIPSTIEPAPLVVDRDELFRRMLDDTLPLTPQQVKALKARIDQAQRAAATPVRNPPRPVSTSIRVSLNPGAVMPPVRIAPNIVTSLTFVDSTGAPWPVKDVVPGSKAFDVKRPTPATVTVSPLSPYAYGNLKIFLVGEEAPVRLILVSQQKEVDEHAEVRVSDGRGPNARMAVTKTQMPDSMNPVLQSFLDGITPQGARRLKVSGGDAVAWHMNGKLYLRTRSILLSPAEIGSGFSADGTAAYELPLTPSVMVSVDGQRRYLKIQEPDGGK